MPLVEAINACPDPFTKAAASHSTSVADTLSVFAGLMDIQLPYIVMNAFQSSSRELSSLPPSLLARLLSCTHAVESLPKNMSKLLNSIIRTRSTITVTDAMLADFYKIVHMLGGYILALYQFLGTHKKVLKTPGNRPYRTLDLLFSSSLSPTLLSKLLGTFLEWSDASLSQKIPFQLNSTQKFDIFSMFSFYTCHFVTSDDAKIGTLYGLEVILALSSGKWVWPFFEGATQNLTLFLQGDPNSTTDEDLMQVVMYPMSIVMEQAVKEILQQPEEGRHFCSNIEQTFAQESFYAHVLVFFDMIRAWLSKDNVTRHGRLVCLSCILACRTALAQAAMIKAGNDRTAPNWQHITESLISIGDTWMQMLDDLKSPDDPPEDKLSPEFYSSTLMLTDLFHSFSAIMQEMDFKRNPVSAHDRIQFLKCVERLGSIAASIPRVLVALHANDDGTYDAAIYDDDKPLSTGRILDFAFTLAYSCYESMPANTADSSELFDELTSAAVAAIETLAKAALLISAVPTPELRFEMITNSMFEDEITEENVDEIWLNDIFLCFLTLLNVLNKKNRSTSPEKLVCVQLTIMKVFASLPETMLSCIDLMLFLSRDNEVPIYNTLIGDAGLSMLPSDGPGCEAMLLAIENLALTIPHLAPYAGEARERMTKEIKTIDKNESKRLVRRGKALAHRGCANLGCTQLKKRCDKPLGSLLCGQCSTVKYCSKECQKADWKDHKLSCKELEKLK